jgi:hypothetical protein
MWTPVYGIEYYIVLNAQYDYFDIVPELEKAFRHRFEINNHGDYSILTVIDYTKTMARYETTEHHKVRSNGLLLRRISDEDAEKFIQLSPEEQKQQLEANKSMQNIIKRNMIDLFESYEIKP